jgi:hypothetical protein
MKKIIFPSMLVISLIAFAQYTQKDQHNIDETFISQSGDQMFNDEFQFELNMEEQDEAFEFETKNYLPFDFNAYKGLFTLEYEMAIVEEDIPFEFDTKKYLPIGFSSYCQIELSEIFEVETVEEDAAFDFDTKMYLPENFNPYYNNFSSNDIAIL